MNDLLSALGFRRRFFSRLVIAALISGGVLATLLATSLIGRDGSAALGAHLLLWIVWFLWLGWLFPASRERRLHTNPAMAYQRAFLIDILPGIWLAFAQLSRPVLAALLNPPGAVSWLQAMAAITLIGAGGLLVYSGHHSMDVATTTFVYEYNPAGPRLYKSGIYARLSHPMFFGAVLISLGAGIFAGGLALWLGLINLCTVPVYSYVEDRRLMRVFGPDFAGYRDSVGGFLPKG